MNKSRAVFLDKDGTLIDDRPYNVDPRHIRLARGAEEGLPRLHAEGYRLVVISNQSGVARGFFPEIALLGVKDRLQALLEGLGVPLAGFYWCPHHPQGSVKKYAMACACRKPEPGLLLRAAEEQGLDPGKSWFVGDILDDVEAGHRAGCRSLLLLNGHETEWRLTGVRQPDLMAADLAEAARFILAVGACNREEQPSLTERNEGTFHELGTA